MNVDVPLVGDFHTTAPSCWPTSRPAPRRSTSAHQPGNVGAGRKRDRSSPPSSRRLPLRQTGAHRRQLGQPRPVVLARMMDENAARAEPRDAMRVMRRRWSSPRSNPRQGREALGLAASASSCRPRSGVQDLIAVYRDSRAKCDYPLHLGLTEAGMGRRASSLHRRAGRAAAGRHRRHHPRLARRSRRAARRRSSSRRRDPADHGPARLHADGDSLPGMRVAPPAPSSGARRRGGSSDSAGADAGVARVSTASENRRSR